MYNKNLSERFILRLSQNDFDFLCSVANERNCSLSEVVRSFISYFRLHGGVVHGYTKSNIND